MNNNIKKPYFIKDKIEKLFGSSNMAKSSFSEGCKNIVNLPALGKQLLEAAKFGKDDDVRLLLTQGAPFTSDWLGISSLHLACMNGHRSTAEILIRAGVAFDGRTKMDKTPLHLAAQKGHHDIVSRLLSVNADVNAVDMLKMTPLHWAVTEKHFLVVKLLVENNADLNLQSKFDKTPLDIAEDACDFHIVFFLKAQGKTSTYINDINENDDTSIQTTSQTDSGANSLLASLASLSSYNFEPLPWVTNELLSQSNASSSQLLLEGANVVTLTEAGKLALQTWSTLQEQEEQAAKEEEKQSSEIPSTSTSVADSNDHELLSITVANQMFTNSLNSSSINNQPLTVLISPQRSIINGTKPFRNPLNKKRDITSHQRVPDADASFDTPFDYRDEEVGESMKEQLQRQLEAANSDAEHYREKLLIKEQEACLWRKKLEMLHSGT